ncbi:MAG: oligosaccharide flippase family protein [Anaerolineae bacterium]
MTVASHRPTLAERVTSAMFWNSALLPVKTALTMLSSVIVVRSLSQTDYALFADILALLATIGTWSDLGIENTLQKFIPEVEQRFGRRGLVQFITILLGFKFTLLAVVLGGIYFYWDTVAASIHLESGPSPYFQALVLLLVLGILSDFGLEFLITYFHQKATNSLDIIFAIVQPLLVILFVWFGWGVPGVLYARVIATLVYVLFAIVFIARLWGQLAPAAEIKGHWSNLWPRFSRQSLVQFLSNGVSYFSDRPYVLIVLTFYGDVASVALFDVAFQRVLTPIRQFLVSSLSGVPFPLFARLYVKKDLVKLQEAYASLSRFMTLMLVPSAAGLCMLAPNLIRLVFQARYEPAAAATIILVITLFGESLFHPAQLVVLAFEENRIFLAARLITIVAAPLLFLYVPSFGAAGAALAIGLPRLLSRLYASTVVQRKFKLSFPSRFFIKVSLASLLMSAAMALPIGFDRPHDTPETIIRTALAFVAGAVVFVIVFKRMGSIEATDRERLATLKIPFKRYLLAWL